MTEALAVAIPEKVDLDSPRETSLTKAKRIANQIGTKTLNLAGIESIREDKEKLATMGALGALAVVTSLAEYHVIKYWPRELNVLRESGRHPLVGYMAASAASRYKRFNNWISMLSAAVVGDAAAEVGQEVLRNGPRYIPNIVESDRAGNEPDLYLTLIGAQLLHARQVLGQFAGRVKKSTS